MAGKKIDRFKKHKNIKNLKEKVQKKTTKTRKLQKKGGKWYQRTIIIWNYEENVILKKNRSFQKKIFA